MIPMSAENKVEKEVCIQQYSKVLLYILVKYIILVISTLFKTMLKCSNFSQGPKHYAFTYSTVPKNCRGHFGITKCLILYVITAADCLVIVWKMPC